MVPPPDKRARARPFLQPAPPPPLESVRGALQAPLYVASALVLAQYKLSVERTRFLIAELHRIDALPLGSPSVSDHLTNASI